MAGADRARKPAGDRGSRRRRVRGCRAPGASRDPVSDAAAHRMAILAMHQTGLMLIAMQPRLIGVETRAQMRAALQAGRIPVWLPLRMCDRDNSIPQDWSITSDGLAAQIAGDSESLRGMSDQVALLRLHHVHRSSRTGRHRRSAIRGHRLTRWAYLARHWPRRGAQAGRCAGHRRSQSHRCRKACATPPARGRSTRPPHHAIARAPWHKLRSGAVFPPAAPIEAGLRWLKTCCF